MLHTPVAETAQRSDPTKRPPALLPGRQLHPRAGAWTEAGHSFQPPTGGGVQRLRRKCACDGHGECSKCKEDHEQMLHRSAAGAARGVAPQIVHDVLRSPGRPLDRAARSYLEPRFGRDFSHVRVHTDARAARSAAAVNAHAYAVGSNVVFAANRYTPYTAEGARLLAHEISHVVQQEGASVAAPGNLKVGEVNAAEEREADAMAGRTAGAKAPPLRAFMNSSAQSLRRTVVVNPPASASEIVGHFNFLCPGNFGSSGGTITQNCNTSSASCDCLCDVTSDTTRTYTINVAPAIAGTETAELPSQGVSAVIPSTSLFPHTLNGPNPTIDFPAISSNVEFGSFLPNSRGAWAPLWRVLAHELCGHARLNQSYAGSTGNRPGHDSTIDTENAIAAEHGEPARGHFADVPRQGESFFNPVGDRSKVVFSLVDGRHFEKP